MPFNSIELYKIAMQMEESGIAYYTKAADFVKNEVLQDIFRNLVEMEHKHHHLFAKLEKHTQACSYSDSDEIAIYLKEKYPSPVFPLVDSQKIGSELKTVVEILEFALNKEQETIEYYSILKESLNNPETHMTIDKIIEEEKMHKTILSGQIENLRK